MYYGDALKDSWSYLFEAIKNRYILCAATIRPEGKSHDDDIYGIRYGHAYSILDVKHYTQNGYDLKLVLLRNPWGKYEWKGDYSDNSSKWNDELKKFFNYHLVITDNGIFWLPFDDFCKYFYNLIICECPDITI